MTELDKGKDPASAALLRSRQLGTYCTGNAYPVHLVLAAVYPLLAAIHQTNPDLIKHVVDGDHRAVSRKALAALRKGMADDHSLEPAPKRARKGTGLGSFRDFEWNSDW